MNLSAVSTQQSPDLQHLHDEGFVVLRNIFSKEKIDRFTRAYDRRWAEIRRVLSRKRDQESFWYKDSEVTVLEEGRYDISLEGGVFDEPDPPIVRSLVKSELKSDYKRYVGGLPSLKDSHDGSWHRDVYSLFGDERLEITLPPFYFTVLVPLVDITADIGPTEVLRRSHRIPRARCDARSAPELALGDALLMDGMVYHRGTRNRTSEERKMLYIVYCKKWYDDY